MSDARSTSRGCTLAGCLLFLLCGCRTSGIEWRSHSSFRATRQDLSLAQVDPREILTGRIQRNLHYVSIALDTVFFRNLPGVVGTTDVAFGFEIEGALPDGRRIQSVPDIQRPTGRNGFLSFDNLALLEPFLYTGQNVTITLHFRAVPSVAAERIRGQIAGAGDAVKKLNPLARAAVERAGALFASIVESFSAERRWSYRFTLYPSDGVIRDKPEILFTAARHILLTGAPADAPEAFRQVKTQHLVQGLKLRGNRLVWKDTEEEYSLTPYVVLNVTRYRRYPKEGTELRRIATTLHKHYEHGNLVLARATLPALGAAIVEDQVITSTEKNLERSWKRCWEARLDGAEAAKRGDLAQRNRARVKEARILLRMKKQFRSILERYELKDIDYRIGTLRQELFEKPPQGDEEILALGRLLAADKEEERTLAEREREEQEQLLRRFAVAAASSPAPSLAVAPRQLDYTERKPAFYERWWFWTIVGAAATGAAAAALLGARGGSLGSAAVIGR